MYIERVRRMLFRRSNASVLPSIQGKTTQRPIFVLGESDDDRIKRLCLSKFKVSADSVYVASTSHHGIRGDVHAEGEGKIKSGLLLSILRRLELTVKSGE